MNTFSSLCSSDNWTAQAIVLSKLILEYPMGLSKIMLSTSFSNLKRPDLKSRFKEIPNETSTQLIQSTAQNSRKFPQSMLEQDLLFLNIDTETIVLLNSRFNILESIHPKFWENTQFRLSGAIISTINQKRTVLPDENLLPLISPTSPFLEKFLVCETYATNYKTSSVIFKFKIDYISEIKTTGKSKRVDVCLHDRQTKLFLLLDDDNVGITSLFEKDDNLYILNPLLTGFSKANQENQTFISYGPETILFLQPKPSSDCIPTQSSLIRSDSGTLDYRTLKTRLFTRDIRHDAINIVLFGRVSKVRSNNEKDGICRFRIGLEDESGSVDITFWDKIGIEASSLLIGEVILVTNLRSSKTRDNFYISGEDDLETRIFRISNSRGLLVSSELREMHDISTNCGNFQASLCLVSFPDSNDWSNIMVPIDSRCRRIGSLEKKEADFYCTHCKMKPLNVEHVIYVLVELVDQVGSTAIAEVFDKNAECLFGISILEFCNMDGDSKCRVFMDVIGRQFDMSVTRIENEKASIRIDCVVKQPAPLFRVKQLLDTYLPIPRQPTIPSMHVNTWRDKLKTPRACDDSNLMRRRSFSRTNSAPFLKITTQTPNSPIKRKRPLEESLF